MPSAGGAGGQRLWWVCADLLPAGDGGAQVPAGRNWQGPLPHASRQRPGASEWAMAPGCSSSLVPPGRKREGEPKGLGTQGSPCPCQGTSSCPEGKSERGKHGGAGQSHASPSRGAASVTCISSSLPLAGLVGPTALAPGPLLLQGSFPSFRHHGSSRCGFVGPLSPGLVP